MKSHQETGGKVALFLSSEHEELTRRKNVKPGGLMGCRTAGLNFLIDFVCSTEEASSLLASMGQSDLAVFDEALTVEVIGSLALVGIGIVLVNQKRKAR